MLNSIKPYLLFMILTQAHSGEIVIGTGVSNYGGLLKEPYLNEQSFHFTPYAGYQVGSSNLIYRWKVQTVSANKYCLFCEGDLNVRYLRATQEVKYKVSKAIHAGFSLGYQYQKSVYEFPKCTGFLGCDDWSASDHLAGDIIDVTNYFVPQALINLDGNRFEATLLFGYPFQLSNTRRNNVYVDAGWDSGGHMEIPSFSEKENTGVLLELNIGIKFKL